MQADRATAAVDLEARYQIPPNLLFELLADPRQHDKIFDAILVRRSELWLCCAHHAVMSVSQPGSWHATAVGKLPCSPVASMSLSNAFSKRGMHSASSNLPPCSSKCSFKQAISAAPSASLTVVNPRSDTMHSRWKKLPCVNLLLSGVLCHGVPCSPLMLSF